MYILFFKKIKATDKLPIAVHFVPVYSSMVAFYQIDFNVFVCHCRKHTFFTWVLKWCIERWVMKMMHLMTDLKFTYPQNCCVAPKPSLPATFRKLKAQECTWFKHGTAWVGLSDSVKRKKGKLWLCFRYC